MSDTTKESRAVLSNVEIEQLVTSIYTSDIKDRKIPHFELVRRSRYSAKLKLDDADKGKDITFEFRNYDLRYRYSLDEQKNNDENLIVYNIKGKKEEQSLSLSPDDMELLSKAVDDYIKPIYEQLPSAMMSSDLSDEKSKSSKIDDGKPRYELESFLEYASYKRKLDSQEKDKLIYRICKDEFTGHYYINTGLYSGLISFVVKNRQKYQTRQLEIRPIYSEELYFRMLNTICGLYIDENQSDKSSNPTMSRYALIIEHLYLASLRKAMGQIIPKKYIYPRERGYNIRGNVDINAYINHDMFEGDKKVTYIYPERVEIRNILDVLYAALKLCRIKNKSKMLPNLASFENFLRENSSGRFPSDQVINNILREKCLQNSLYMPFKRPLELAQLLLRHKTVNPGSDADREGINGYVIDSTFLWELYLNDVMRRYLTGWSVSAQSSMLMYKNSGDGQNERTDRFYGKEFYPDFVLTNSETGEAAVLDAKFKKMTFAPEDVDRDDVHQINSYSLYYKIKGDNLRASALVYPTMMDRPERIHYYDSAPLMGNKNASERFNILTFKDDPDNLHESEIKFIEDLRIFLDNDRSR